MNGGQNIELQWIHLEDLFDSWLCIQVCGKGRKYDISYKGFVCRNAEAFDWLICKRGEPAEGIKAGMQVSREQAFQAVELHIENELQTGQ